MRKYLKYSLLIIGVLILVAYISLFILGLGRQKQEFPLTKEEKEVLKLSKQLFPDYEQISFNSTLLNDYIFDSTYSIWIIYESQKIPLPENRKMKCDSIFIALKKIISKEKGYNNIKIAIGSTKSHLDDDVYSYPLEE